MFNALYITSSSSLLSHWYENKIVRFKLNEPSKASSLYIDTHLKRLRPYTHECWDISCTDLRVLVILPGKNVMRRILCLTSTIL